MPEVEIGTVMEYFARPVVAGLDLTQALQVGDRIHIKGHTTDIELTVESNQVENSTVTEDSAEQSVGVKVGDRVHRGDTVYKVVD